MLGGSIEAEESDSYSIGNKGTAIESEDYGGHTIYLFSWLTNQP